MTEPDYDYKYQKYKLKLEQLKNDETEGGAKKKTEQTTNILYTLNSSVILHKIFPPDSKKTFTRVIRGSLRTVPGVAAGVVTLGAGGDVMVDSVFAVESSLGFITDAITLARSIKASKRLFGVLFKIDFKKKLPLVPLIGISHGLEEFEQQFGTRLSYGIEQLLNAQKGSPAFKQKMIKVIDKLNGSINQLMDKITTVLSDWFACLFPDTAGLAGEIAKTMLDHVVANGFYYMKKLFNTIPEQLRHLLTNPKAMKIFIHKAINLLKKLLLHMDPKQVKKMVKALGLKATELISNPLLKGIAGTGVKIIGTGFDLTSSITGNLPGSRITSIGPKPQHILIMIINKYVVPNIGTGVDLFHQLLPIFLMFVLFKEKHVAIKSKITDYKWVAPPPKLNLQDKPQDEKME